MKKEFNLVGATGFNGCWRDLKKERWDFSKENFDGNNVMVLTAFSFTGKLDIHFISNRMNSSEHITMLKNSLLVFLKKFQRKKLIFQQEKIAILDWLLCSFYLSPVENHWGMIISDNYARNKQYDSVEQLKNAISISWNSIAANILSKLSKTMKNCLFQEVNCLQESTNY